MLDFLNDLAETCKSFNLYIVIMIVPLFLLAAPACGSQSFPIFRLQGFEAGSNKNGSFAASISAEATTHVHMSHRKCFIVRMEETDAAQLRDVVRMYPLAIIIILPHSTDHLSEEQKNKWLGVESLLMEQEYPIPIYFAHDSDTVNQVLENLQAVTSTDRGSSAFKALLNAVFGNGFQIVASTPAPAQVPVTKFANVAASLINTRKNVELDSLMFVSHYDALSASADLSSGVDSSGTGPVCLLSLAKTLSGLYANSETQPNLNVNFLLSAAGKVNFLGSNHYLQHNEQSVKKMRLVVALDSLSGLRDSEDGEDVIYFHRKTAKSTSNNQLQELLKFQQILERTAVDAGLKFEVVFRRVNPDQWFQWEHERFSGYRAATISGHSTPYHPMRRSLLDDGRKINVDKLLVKMEVVQKSVLQYLYNVSEVFAIDGGNSRKQLGEEEEEKEHVTEANYYQKFQGLVEREEVETFLKYVATHPHSSQYLSKGDAYVQTLMRHLSRYGRLASLQEFSLERTASAASAPAGASVRREDVVFYDQKQTTANAYRVKPAVFDLFLSAAIAAYVGMVYLTVMGIPVLHSYLQSKLLCLPSVGTSKSKLK